MQRRQDGPREVSLSLWICCHHALSLNEGHDLIFEDVEASRKILVRVLRRPWLAKTLEWPERVQRRVMLEAVSELWQGREHPLHEGESKAKHEKRV